MLGERGGLRCSPGWDWAHVGDASPVKSKGHVFRFGRGGGHEAFCSRGRATPTRQHS